MYTTRLICAKINYFFKDLDIVYVSYIDNKKFYVHDMCLILNTLLQNTDDPNVIKMINTYKNDIVVMKELILYAWDNIFDNMKINPLRERFYIYIGPRQYLIQKWKYGVFESIYELGYLLFGRISYYNDYIYNDYILNRFAKYDILLIFRICCLINLIENDYLNTDIMHVILSKIFFDPIKKLIF